MSHLIDLLHTDEAGSYHHAVKGKVCGYGKEKEKMTLQVKLAYMEDGKDILDNVWWVVPYQGMDYGVFFRPEIGDEVFIIFIGNHQKTAIAIGSLPSNESKLWQNATEKNEEKKICTKGGNEIAFWDEADKNKLEIKNKKLSISLMEEQEELVLQDSKKENLISLSGKRGEANIQAKEKMIFTCGEASLELSKDGTIELKGKTIKLNGQSISIAAQNTLSLQGQKVQLEAKVEASLQAKAKMSVGASGNTEITGGIINIG